MKSFYRISKNKSVFWIGHQFSRNHRRGMEVRRLKKILTVNREVFHYLGFYPEMGKCIEIHWI